MSLHSLFDSGGFAYGQDFFFMSPIIINGDMSVFHIPLSVKKGDMNP